MKSKTKSKEQNTNLSVAIYGACFGPMSRAHSIGSPDGSEEMRGGPQDVLLVEFINSDVACNLKSASVRFWFWFWLFPLVFSFSTRALIFMSMLRATGGRPCSILQGVSPELLLCCSFYFNVETSVEQDCKFCISWVCIFV